MGVKTFLAELFDANFNRFVVPSIVKVLHVLGLVMTTAVVGAFTLTALTGAAVSGDPGIQIVGLIVLLPLAGGLFLLGALVSRVFCESLLVAYRIAENTGRLVEQGEEQTSDDRARPAAVRSTA